MKKQFLALLSIGIGLSASAQFTQSNAPAIGDNQVMYVLDSNATAYTSETGSGANWDYSTVTGVNGLTDTYSIVDPSTTTNASDFTSSAFAAEIQDFMTTYYTTSATNQMGQGFVFSDPTLGDVIATFETDDAELKDYPMNYGDPMITDTYAGTAHLTVFGSPMTPPMTGSLHAVVDGEGTLSLHSNTYSNVIRYKLVDTMNATLSGVLLSGPVQVTRTQYEYYDFSTSNLPLFVYISFHITGTLNVGNIDKLQHIVLSVDDPTVTQATCEVTGLSHTVPSYSGSTLTWDGTATDNFEYVFDQNSADPTGAGTAITGTSYSTGALTNAVYYFHLRKNCGNGNYSAWVTETIDATSLSISNEKIVPFKMFPNPAESKIKIAFNKPFAKAHIVITDALGKNVMEKEITPSNSEVNISRLVNGVYFVQLETIEGITTQKLIVR